MPGLKLWMIIAAIVAVMAAPVFAGRPGDRGDTPGLGWGKGGSHSRAAPGPIAGVGLPVLAVAGGYVWIVRRNRRAKAERRSPQA